jgi:hypothetical protein
MSISELSESREISLTDLKLIFHGSVIRRPVVERSIIPTAKKENNVNCI